MSKHLCIACIALLTGLPAYAADLGAPRLSASLAAEMFFKTDQFLTSGGLKFFGGSPITLEPQVGLGYTAREQELNKGFEESIHKLHAQAGGKFDLGGTFFFSAAAKLPVYSYAKSEQRFAASAAPDNISHHAYDLTRLPGSRLTWTGEVGIRLGKETELNFYYDQTQFDSMQPGLSRPEERFGTRFIIRFK